MFIETYDRYTKRRVILNTDDVSRIEEQASGYCTIYFKTVADVSRIEEQASGYCTIYFKTVADDFDGTKHQIKMDVLDKYEDIRNFFIP